MLSKRLGLCRLPTGRFRTALIGKQTIRDESLEQRMLRDLAHLSAYW